MDIEMKTYEDPANRRATLAATINHDQMLIRMTGEEVLRQIASKIATRYVEENYREIIAKLDQNAIANLAIADAGKKIAEEIRTRPVILKERTTNIKNSIF